MPTILRLVGAKRFVDARVRRTSAIEFGEEVTVEDPEVAADLKKATFMNKYNEPSPMFEVVSESPGSVEQIHSPDKEDMEEDEPEEQEKDEPVAEEKPKPAATRRGGRAKAK